MNEIVCASCGRATPEAAIVCPSCDAGPSAAEPLRSARREFSDLRAGRAAVVLGFVIGVGMPLVGIASGVYGLYRLFRVPDDVRGVRAWRAFGVVTVMIVAFLWGAAEQLRRAS
jgi:hypothetical protein